MKRNAVLQTVLRFGFGAGVLYLSWALFLVGTKQNPFGPKWGMTLIVPPVTVLLSQWFVRRYYADGPGFARSVLTGLLTAVLGAALSALTLLELGRLADPALLQRNYQEARQILTASRADFVKNDVSKKIYEENMRLLAQAAGTPEGVAGSDLTRKLLLGLMLCLPGAIFFRK